ncbi:hypothetical protein R3P38DRAFT_3218520 [Favolaschia claudopus]|uniref:Uncharacterized protein n=1 Tax=Favolaschia claudopus TaxID=2862362 RepID=A0AAW0A4F9_9AGAR
MTAPDFVPRCLLFSHQIEYQALILRILGSTDISVIDVADANRILTILNAVWDTGMFHAQKLLPNIIYLLDHTLPTIRRIKQARALFLFFTAPALIPYHVNDNAFAVAFFIEGSDPFQAVELSYVLVRFFDKYIRGSNYTRFNALKISFVLDNDGTYGILVLDPRFRPIYKRMQKRAWNFPNKYSASELGVPLSTWPKNCVAMKNTILILKLNEYAEILARGRA